MGVGQLSESDAVDALRLPFYSSSHPTGSHGWRNQFDLGNPDVGEDLNGSRDVFIHYRLTGEPRRVSISSQREEANNTSFNTTLSANGRFVVFQSRATNLVLGDNNNRNDLFVHDLQTNQTTRLSVSSDGQEGNSDSRAPSISADGRFVAFYTDATNLVPDDNNNRADVVVHDRQTGETTRASVSSDGQEGNESSLSPSISADGRFVAFWSDASNLVAADNNGQKDVFVHDRQTGETTRVSVSSDGQAANGKSDSPSISADGRFVAFRSDADSLVEANITTFEVLVHDRHTLKTELVSRSFQGRSSNADSGSPRISADGMRVAFDSHSVNLVPGDDNETTDVFAALNPLTYCNGLSATIVGTNGPDVLDGTNGNDVILGLGGNDIIRGFGGDDSICEDRGRDTIDGGADNDWISGGSGADRIHGGFGNDTIFGGSHADLILGGPGGDLIQGNSGADGIYAGSGDDIVYGNRGPDDLFGNEGVDMLFGNQGTDTLDCGPGTDIGDGGPGILDTADPNCELQAGIP